MIALAEIIVLAHKGEEVIYVAIPLLIIFALMAISARRDDDEDDEDDEDES